MRTGIHPQYMTATVKCACGHSFQTRSVRPEYHLEICSQCHPFFTGKQRLVDSAGRVERFTKRFQKTGGKTVHVAAKTKPAKVLSSAKNVLSSGARVAKTAKTENKPASKKSK
ncbi:MAG: 50S ribosomal protein L31 [Elusimicrobia bacterium]|nr:50S ribosomal protein L31 [Elusimicrobiota bacterium]MBI2916000.1 50S ribosomal protein L31 [Elusimicrobiota bacterium]MBI3012889.1 50S ribosomal protein L31 [Elusimicrobiota bacterium]